MERARFGVPKHPKYVLVLFFVFFPLSRLQKLMEKIFSGEMKKSMR